VIFDIVKDVQEICPDAWIINFTNPAGMVTEAVYRHTNFKRFIGVCNIPIGMKMFITDVLQLSRKMNCISTCLVSITWCSFAMCW
jgi:6-phospho-beta-glucosidase